MIQPNNLSRPERWVTHWDRRTSLWFILGLSAWFLLQAWQAHWGITFSWVLTLKGIPLLAGAALFYSWLDRSPRSRLGFFPLLWLGLSRYQWNFCETMDHRSWYWALLFLAWILLILAVRDGKKLALLLSPLWLGMGFVWKASLPLGLAFLGFSRSRIRAKGWVCAAGIACLAVSTLFQGEWNHGAWNGLGFYEFLVSRRMILYFILGWFGWSVLPGRSRESAAASSLLWISLGYLIWSSYSAPFSMDDQAFGWFLQLWAGVGLEAFRRQVLDASLPAQWVWAVFGVVLGLVAFPGVITDLF
jgi:hypothetical protein